LLGSREVAAKGGFAISSEWLEGMSCGPEGMQRTLELADFLDNAPDPPSAEALQQFYLDQYTRWVVGEEQPPPMPKRIEDFDERLRSPELEEAQATRFLTC
jgi:hypothetical protein